MAISTCHRSEDSKAEWMLQVVSLLASLVFSDQNQMVDSDALAVDGAIVLYLSVYMIISEVSSSPDAP